MTERTKGGPARSLSIVRSAIAFTALLTGCAAASPPSVRPTAVLGTIPGGLDNPPATIVATLSTTVLPEKTPTLVISTTTEPPATSTMPSVVVTAVAPVAPPTPSPIPPSAAPADATVRAVTRAPEPRSTVPSARLGVPVSPDEVVRGDRSRPWVSLVFNVGGGSTLGMAILDTLHAKGVHTTFFLMGWWVDRQPAIVRRIASDGHEIASHGYGILDLTQASDRAVIADLNQADRSIAAIIGHSTRPLWMPSAGYRDARVRSLAASLGFRPIYWTLDSGDWQVDATAAGVRQRVLAGAENGAIIVMHFDSTRTADTIAATLPSLVDGLRGQGFRLVTISELISGQLRSATDP